MKTARAEFRLTREEEEESVFVRAQAVVEAHAAGEITELSAADRKCLNTVVRRARLAQLKHPNCAIELSPYLISILGLED